MHASRGKVRNIDFSSDSKVGRIRFEDGNRMFFTCVTFADYALDLPAWGIRVTHLFITSPLSYFLQDYNYARLRPQALGLGSHLSCNASKELSNCTCH